MTLTTELLREVGEALYGPQWQVALARDLGVSDRTMRRWAAGEVTPSARAAAPLGRLAAARAATLTTLAHRLPSA